jgi:valyl-tRNA synthetase
LKINVNRLFDSYLYGEAGRQIHEFLWGDFADWYVEVAKVQLREGSGRAHLTMQVLFNGLDTCLRLLHPYIPFVTEETWQQLRQAFQSADIGVGPADGWSDALIIANWPDSGSESSEEFYAAAAEFERMRQLIRNIRAARSEYKVEPGRFVPATIVAGDKSPFFEAQKSVLVQMARLDEANLRILMSSDSPVVDVVTISLGDIIAYLPLTGLIDTEKEKTRLTSELAELEKQISRLSGLLNSEFSQKAPENVVQRERDKLKMFQASQQEVKDRLNALV